MAKPRIRQPVEMCVCFNFATLFKNIQEELNNRRRDCWSDEYIDEFMRNLSSFSLNGQKFDFTSMDLPFGGKKFFVLCPRCRQKKRKLYLPNRYEDREQRYLCPKCHTLATMVTLKCKSPKYRSIVKPLRRMQWLKEKLLKDSITPEKAAPLLKEYEAIESSLKNSPEYRLWKFNMEHRPPTRV